jgi:5'-nucleotidase
MDRPVALVTNDDGIDCGYLHALVDALTKTFDVRVVGPALEQSWAGRSFSRRGRFIVEERTDLPWPAWSVAGTPSDCVNIALGSILTEEVAIVVSGINIGFNVSLPLVMTSGTVAAALEGALWGLPALAVSQSIPHSAFDDVKQSNGHVSGSLKTHLVAAAERAAEVAQTLLGERHETTVHNLNFPAEVTAEARIETTRLSNARLGSLFEGTVGQEFQFAFPQDRRVIFEPEDSDVSCLKRGQISHTVLDYSVLGR